jgi:hypothetical protein
LGITGVTENPPGFPRLLNRDFQSAWSAGLFEVRKSEIWQNKILWLLFFSPRFTVLISG